MTDINTENFWKKMAGLLSFFMVIALIMLFNESVRYPPESAYNRYQEMYENIMQDLDVLVEVTPRLQKPVTKSDLLKIVEEECEHVRIHEGLPESPFVRINSLRTLRTPTMGRSLQLPLLPGAHN